MSKAITILLVGCLFVAVAVLGWRLAEPAVQAVPIQALVDDSGRWQAVDDRIAALEATVARQRKAIMRASELLEMEAAAADRGLSRPARRPDYTDEVRAQLGTK